jgi:tetratricopeptide (TPR) repeat protein
MTENEKIAEMLKMINKTAIFEYSRGNYAKAIEVFEKGRMLEETVGLKKQAAESIVNIGNVYYTTGEYQIALEKYSQALEIFKRERDSTGVYMVYQLMGQIYFNTGKYGQAAQAFDTCIRMNLGNKERATAYFQAGITFARLNNTLRAQEYITRALTEFERLEEKDSIIECLTERALLFKNAGRKDLAVQDLRKCLKIADGNENLLKGIQEQLASI